MQGLAEILQQALGMAKEKAQKQEDEQKRQQDEMELHRLWRSLGEKNEQGGQLLIYMGK